MPDLNQLFGACACERNQYTVIIPASSASTAQVFFDNSAANRRSQATPVTAWLRVPLDWYHSSTFAQFPDETHTSIRRYQIDGTFHSHIHPTLPPTRRQFCGYCGTHLTAWSEVEQLSDFMDVTLGSLLNESLQKLEELDIIPDAADEGEEGLVRGGEVEEEDHIPTNEETMDDVDTAVTTSNSGSTQAHRMQNRGLPYFEEMVEHSRLGRIKRQKGGHTSRDGTTTVQWEVIEIDGDEPTPMETTVDTATEPEREESSHKRQKTKQ